MNSQELNLDDYVLHFSKRLRTIILSCFCRSGPQFDDLYQIGNLAVIEAYNNYNPDCGSTIDGWVERIVRYRLLDYIRSDVLLGKNRFRSYRSKLTVESLHTSEVWERVKSIPDHNVLTNPEYVAYLSEIKSVMDRVISTSPRLQYIMYSYFYKDKTMKLISRDLKVTESRISQLISKVIRDMRVVLINS